MPPRTLQVLLVDDDDALRDTLARIVEKEGHVVVTAANGIAALRKLDEARFDLILTDIVMPDMEGLEFLRRLRVLPVRPKVIAMSGGGRASPSNYLELARSFGADATLEKPFLASALMAEIQRLTESVTPADPAAQ